MISVNVCDHKASCFTRTGLGTLKSRLKSSGLVG
jgi:hypothetical protein